METTDTQAQNERPSAATGGSALALDRLCRLMSQADSLNDRWRKDHTKLLCEAGEVMRDERYRARLSLRELARRMKISAAYLSDMENGQRRYSIELAKRAMAVMQNSDYPEQLSR